MNSSNQLRESILIFLGVALGPNSADAQPLSITHRTVEARVAQADHVVVGTIDKVTRKEIVAPGGIGIKYPDGQFEFTITLKIDETLKGDLKGMVADLQAIQSAGYDKRYEEWSKAGTSLLCLLGPTPKKSKERHWDVLPVGKRVGAEDLYGGRHELMFSLDFTILKNEKEILERARRFARTSQKVLPVHSIQIPGEISKGSGHWDYLLVPVEPTLERRARQLVESPDDFAPRGENLSPNGRYRLRSSGVNALRYFNSADNRALLRSVLDAPLTDIEKSMEYAVRAKAYEVLLHWDEDVSLPKCAQELKSLNLAGSAVTDKGLRQLAELKNLEKLDLQDTKVTDKGLKELARLKKLKSLRLSEAQMSDATVRILREIGLLHSLSQASAGRGDPPRSAEEIISLSLCRGPLTDAGLRELAGLKNLSWLDLRETRVTDAGLKELAGLKKLGRVLLQDTQVTDAGVAELQRALPNCEIAR